MNHNHNAITIIFLFTVLLNACNLGEMSQTEIRQALDGDNKNNLMEAIYQIGEQRDTAFIDDLFKFSYDQRVSHQSKFLGMSVHYACMGALKKISNQLPPNKIDYKVDSINVAFYKKVFKRD